jgi:hypothetical protein
MPEPRHSDFIAGRNRQKSKILTRLAWGKQRGNEHLIEELDVAFAPALGGDESYAIALGLSLPEQTALLLRAGGASPAGWGSGIEEHGNLLNSVAKLKLNAFKLKT